VEAIVPPELLFAIGLFLGVLLRTLLPWLEKKAADPQLAFDPKFVWTAILSLITAFIEVAAILADSPTAFTTFGPLLAFLSGLFFGLGNNEIWNRILHRGKK